MPNHRRFTFPTIGPAGAHREPASTTKSASPTGPRPRRGCHLVDRSKLSELCLWQGHRAIAQVEHRLSIDRAGVRGQPILPGPAAGQSRCGSTLDLDVVTVAAVQHIVTRAAKQDVVAGITQDG